MASPSKSLAKTIQQGSPFKSQQQELYLSLVRTAAELSRSTDHFLRAFGITQMQYNVLRILQGAGPKGLGRNEISDRMITSAPDMTRLLDRMEREGFVLRNRASDDKRQVATTITPDGVALLSKVEVPLLQLHKDQLSHLGEKSTTDALEWLASIRGSLST